MTPADYLRGIVLPTLAEFVASPDDQRRAYLACITAHHLGDYVVRSGRIDMKMARNAVADGVGYVECCLEIVEGVCNGTKHAGTGRTSAFPFVPGRERHVPTFALGVPGAGLDEGRWDKPGLMVGHRIADGSPGSGGYFIDDCVCVVVRAFATAFPDVFGGVDLGIIAPELDRAARFSAMMALLSRAAS